MPKKEAGFVFLPKTADVKFQAFGKNLEEALKNAAYAMFSLMVEERVVGRIKREIHTSAESEEELIVKFLEEFLFLRDSEGLILSSIENLKITVGRGILNLNAIAMFDSLKNYKYREVVKAVTFNELNISKNQDRVVLQVVLDT